jgi:membrane-associated phospholipid phosphatase
LAIYTRAVRSAAVVLFVALVPAAYGNAIVDEARQYGRDFKAVVFAPAHWQRAEWGRAALTIGTIVVLMHEDQHIAHTIQDRRNSQTNSISKAVTPFGGGRGLQLSVAMIAAGLLAKNHELRDTGGDALESSIIAAGVITPLLKRGFGRARPNQDEMTSHDFDPGSMQQSFPSGHATNAFAIASAIAGHSKGWVVPTVAYTIASSVAFARMNDNVHWASDVFAGAVIGTATGKMIVNRHRSSARRADWSVLPIVSSRGGGFVVHVTTR